MSNAPRGTAISHQALLLGMCTVGARQGGRRPQMPLALPVPRSPRRDNRGSSASHLPRPVLPLATGLCDTHRACEVCQAWRVEQGGGLSGLNLGGQLGAG